MKIISPSLLNSDTYQIKEQFEALEKCGINYIHIDSPCPLFAFYQ